MTFDYQIVLPVITHHVNKKNDFFFLAMSLVLLVIVAVGFAPSFYFRNLYQPNNGHGPGGLPTYILVHGIIMSAWLLFLIVQSSLIRTRLVRIHRKVGWVGACIALLILLSGLLVMRGFGPRLLALGVPPSILREGLSLLFWIDVFSLMIFPGLVAAGLYFRKYADTHKRLMLFSTITIMLPGLGRLTAQIAETNSFGGINWPMTWTIFSLCLLTVPVYDMLQFRRLQKSTIGSVAVIGGSMLLAVLFAGTEWGKDLSVSHFMD